MADFFPKAFPASAEEKVMEAMMKTAYFEIREQGVLIAIQELTAGAAWKLQNAGYRLRRVR